MVDPSGKGSESEDGNPNSAAAAAAASSGSEQKKTCADCGTTKTPLWRGGPAGPKSLCNACGIRSRKKKRAILGISKGNSNNSHNSSNNHHEDGNGMIKKGKRSSKVGGGGGGDSAARLKQRLLDVGREVLMQRSHWKKLGEEEQAAVLLMSLSYGSVYA